MTNALRLYDYFTVLGWPLFLFLLIEIFFTFLGWDDVVDSYLSFLTFHWALRIVFFVLSGYLVAFRLPGTGKDGVIAGIYVGFLIGFAYGLFLYIDTPTLGNFLSLLALPFQTLVVGILVVGLVTFFLYHFRKERDTIE